MVGPFKYRSCVRFSNETDTSRGRDGDAGALLLPGQGAPPKAARDGSETDRAAIDRLHEQDRDATLSDSADQLAKLWDKDAVRFSIGRPAEIGAAVIYADDKRVPHTRVLRVGILVLSHCPVSPSKQTTSRDEPRNHSNTKSPRR